VKIWDNRQNIDIDQSFRSYLFRIAENKAYDFFRKAARDKKLQAQVLVAATEHYEHIESMLFNKENLAILNGAIESLPSQRQQVFRLCKLERKSYQEVSELLGISTSTVSDHIVKATRSVKEYLFANLKSTILVASLSLLLF